ncbi:MAG: hypothetical protein R3C28_09200 [Pirellulaceae bacterium]
MLEPGQRIVVVEDENAFRFRYGADIVVAGEWSGGLNNSREMIQLVDGQQVVQAFSYSDHWFPETDGRGRSWKRAFRYQ